MKRPRRYMHRPGMRFDRRHVQGPDAGFLGTEIDVTIFTGSVMTSATQRLTGSAVVKESIGPFGTYDETRILKRNLLGQGTGSVGRANGRIVARTGSIPSWTNSHIKNSSFVATALSASDHESQVLNLYFSGTQPVESSPVPASASMYYAKSGRYSYVVVKKTASQNDTTRLPTGMDGFTPVRFVSGKGTDITSVTGSVAWYPPASVADAVGSSVLYPCMIPIDVPYQGKIVDVKVWVELTQVSGTGNAGGGVVPGKYPLGSLMVALRSPNVRGFHAHPIRNDVNLKKVFTSNLTDFSAWGAFSTPGRSLFGPDYITPMWRDTFLLWEGPVVNGEGTVGPWDLDTETNGGAQFITNKYPVWQRDRGMRVVFSDGAVIPNPRHHVNAGGPSTNYNGAPNAFFGFNKATGFDVPWTSEAEISGSNTYQAAGSPPKGWLTGPGGTNDVNEWPTTGSNYGAAYIRPVYPMLDPLYQRKRYGDLPTYHPGTGEAIFDPDRWTGYRPGLRGTEASGTWYLILADHGDHEAAVGANQYSPTYFRQVRLEFILESGSYNRMPTRGNSRVRARRAKSELLAVTISGTDAGYDATGSWDAHISDTYFAGIEGDVAPEIGRTIGAGFLTGTVENITDLALYYALSGTLADISGVNPGWLFNNQFRMPWIPISSASLVETPVEPVVSVHPQDIMTVRPVISAPIRVAEAARAVYPKLTLARLAMDFITGSSS